MNRFSDAINRVSTVVTITVEIVVFRAEKLKTDFQCVYPTWEQRKNMSDIIQNMSDIF